MPSSYVLQRLAATVPAPLGDALGVTGVTGKSPIITASLQSQLYAGVDVEGWLVPPCRPWRHTR